MQCYFRELAASILDNVLSLIGACRRKGVKVFFTRHGHREPLKDVGMLGEWWGELIIHGTKEWEQVNHGNILLSIITSAFHKTK
jgi:nicotinamidase-related amidase